MKPTAATARAMRWWGDRIAPQGAGQGRLCIINYHRVLDRPDPLLETEPDVESFRAQMRLLAAGFNVLPLHEAVTALSNSRMPPRAVCITFDDGYRSVHDAALPILREYGLPATVFIASAYVQGGKMWNDVIIETIRRLPQGLLDLRDIGLGLHPLGNLPERRQAINTLTDTAKYLAPEARQAAVQKLAAMIVPGASTDAMLTETQIANLAQQGIEIGGHTVTHPILTILPDELARQEIVGCKQQLEHITSQPVRYFAYPNGKFGMDYDARHVQMVKDAGYLAAFSTAIGAATARHDRFEMPRSRPWRSAQLLFGMHLLRWLAGGRK